jgi:hypothetical protein
MNKLTLIFWIIVICCGAALEGFGITNANDWTFTAIVRNVIPIWVRAPILGWLCYHFLVQKGR